MSERRLFYETIAREFDGLMDAYDLQRRLEVVFDELLPQDLTGATVLDLGCGTGRFSQRAHERGAQVMSVDISQALARLARGRTQALAVAADASAIPLPSGRFEIIVSSEMLEHLEQPEQGIREIARVLAPGGRVILTTPNRRWLWLVGLATRLKLRPFAGYENFLGFQELRALFEKYGLQVETHRGFHPWPFQLAGLRALSRQIDRQFGGGRWGAWMINQAVRARKPAPG